MDKIILIGGAPTAGKSHTAEELSKRLGIPWISTDMIREIMRVVADRNKYPAIFDLEEVTAEQHLTKLSPTEIVAHQNAESESVWEGIKAFIEKTYNWNECIIEGVAILPHLVNKDFLGDTKVSTYFLFNKDEEQIRDVVYNRGLWDEAKKYSDELKPKEVAWVIEFNAWLKGELQKYTYKSFVTGDIDAIEEDIKTNNN